MEGEEREEKVLLTCELVVSSVRGISLGKVLPAVDGRLQEVYQSPDQVGVKVAK